MKQHKKVGSDGIADLKKLYQVERQQQAEIFLLDFISSDEASDPVTKGTIFCSSIIILFFCESINISLSLFLRLFVLSCHERHWLLLLFCN